MQEHLSDFPLPSLPPFLGPSRHTCGIVMSLGPVWFLNLSIMVNFEWRGTEMKFPLGQKVTAAKLDKIYHVSKTVRHQNIFFV